MKNPVDGFLREREAVVLSAIRESYRNYGRAPTYKELLAAIGIKRPTSALMVVYALKRKGLVEWEEGSRPGYMLSRTLMLTEKAGGMPGRARRRAGLKVIGVVR